MLLSFIFIINLFAQINILNDNKVVRVALRCLVTMVIRLGKTVRVTLMNKICFEIDFFYWKLIMRSSNFLPYCVPFPQVQYPIHRHTHSTIILNILIRRKYTFFIMNLVVPCALIACMIFLVFVLPAKSGERISLGITVMLSMAIFQELSSEKLPSSSDNYPLLGKCGLDYAFIQSTIRSFDLCI